MRWFMAALAALALAWAAYMASPYLALRDLGRAVQTRDEQALAQRINFRALRQTLSRHIVADLSASDRVGALSTADIQLAAGALAAAADPLLESILTSRGVSDVLGGRGPAATSPETAPFAKGAPSLSRLVGLLEASQWRGFRNVYFGLPPEAQRPARYRLQMRLSRFQWRLVGIELPEDLRRRIAQEILQRRKTLGR